VHPDQDFHLSLQRAARLRQRDTSRIHHDSRETSSRMASRAELHSCVLDKRSIHAPPALFDLHSIEDEIAKALGRRVDLKSGGYASSTRPRR